MMLWDCHGKSGRVRNLVPGSIFAGKMVSSSDGQLHIYSLTIIGLSTFHDYNNNHDYKYIYAQKVYV